MDEGPVFISYVRSDAEDEARRLATALALRGIAVWLDVLRLKGGDDWDGRIDAAIAGCRAFVVLVSPNTVLSRQVKGELLRAEGFSKHVVPVLLRPAAMPRSLLAVHFIDATNGLADEVFHQIERAVVDSTIISPPRRHSYRVQRAAAVVVASLCVLPLVVYAGLTLKSRLLPSAKSATSQTVEVPSRSRQAESAPTTSRPTSAEKLLSNPTSVDSPQVQMFADTAQDTTNQLDAAMRSRSSLERERDELDRTISRAKLNRMAGSAMQSLLQRRREINRNIGDTSRWIDALLSDRKGSIYSFSAYLSAQPMIKYQGGAVELVSGGKVDPLPARDYSFGVGRPRTNPFPPVYEPPFGILTDRTRRVLQPFEQAGVLGIVNDSYMVIRTDRQVVLGQGREYVYFSVTDSGTLPLSANADHDGRWDGTWRPSNFMRASTPEMWAAADIISTDSPYSPSAPLLPPLNVAIFAAIAARYGRKPQVAGDDRSTN